MIEGYATIIELIGGAMLVYFGYRAFSRRPMPRWKTTEGADKGGADPGRRHRLDLRAYHHQSGHPAGLHRHVCRPGRAGGRGGKL